MNYRIILSMLLIWNCLQASDGNNCVFTDETNSQTSNVTLDAETCSRISNLYELLNILEDDIDRLDDLDRPYKEIEQIRTLLELKKCETLKALSAYKGFEDLANHSPKHRFTSKTDYTVLEMTGYTLLVLGVGVLTLSSVNFTQHTIAAPSSQCAQENLQAIKDLCIKIKSMI